MIRLLVLLALAASPAAAEEPPRRVVSMNLCTDQLVLLVGAPGQVVSVSEWAVSPRASMMAGAAEGLPRNAALAEQIYLMEPDLVVAGTFTRQDSVGMLRRLGIRVEQFPPVRSLDDLRATLARIGTLMGREARAAELIAAFDAALAAEMARPAASIAGRGAFYYQNNYTSGAGTLAHELMAAAGLENLAAVMGFRGAARMPLEVLVMEQPFVIRSATITDSDIGRSSEALDHPAVASLTGARVEERWQVCGTPFVIETVRALIDARSR